MSSHSPADVLEAYGVELQMTIASAATNVADLTFVPKTPTLRVFAEAYGPVLAAKWVQLHLLEVNKFSGVSAKLNDYQLDALAVQIVTAYAGLNLLEFILFCSRLRSGKYEKFYGSVDPMRIMSSLEDFMENRRRDVNRVVEEREKDKREQERAEMKKNSVTFEDWLRGKTPEQLLELAESTPHVVVPTAKRLGLLPREFKVGNTEAEQFGPLGRIIGKVLGG